MSVTIDDIEAAASRIALHVHDTPLLRSTTVAAMAGLDLVAFKCENLQRTGSFKIRGATNAALVKTSAKRRPSRRPSLTATPAPTEPSVVESRPSAVGGTARLDSDGALVPTSFDLPPTTFLPASPFFVLVTHSSGNHGQAVALAARSLGMGCVVVVPSNAPPVKLAAIKGYGAEVVLCDPTQQCREATAHAVLQRINASANDVGQAARIDDRAVFIHPYSDLDVIAGQGTIGTELPDQWRRQFGEDAPDAVIVPVGGGGLISGIATAIKARHPATLVFGAEPEMANDASRSFVAGRAVEGHAPGQPATIADGLRACVSAVTVDHMRRSVDDIILVSEREIRAALRVVMERAKLVVEPSAGVGVAAALFHTERLRGCKRIAIVLCGGNVNLLELPQYIAE